MANRMDAIIEAGIREARRHLGAVAASPTNTPEEVRAYAAGLAEGVKMFLSTRMTAQKNYELFQSIADAIITPTLPRGK